MRSIAIIIILLCSAEVYCQVKVGLDNLIDTDFRILQNKRIALVTHAAARSSRGLSALHEFKLCSAITLSKVFSPEHGYHGVSPAGNHVANDTVDGVFIQSLYGKYRRPDSSMLTNIDAVVVDLQDIGVRSYTYLSTMIEVMTACAEYNLPMYVLDRPNPLGGLVVSGNIPDDSVRSFVCKVPVPYVHGLTLGELAVMANDLGWIDNIENQKRLQTVKLTVVRMKRWKRKFVWEELNRPWYPTSPNIPTVASARNYAVTGLCGELGVFNIGVGSALPFSLLIAPNFSAPQHLIHRLRSYGVYAMDFVSVPQHGKFAQKVCSGLYLQCAADTTFRPFEAACTLLHFTHPMMMYATIDSTLDAGKFQMFTKVMGSNVPLKLLQKESTLSEWLAFAEMGLSTFLKQREKYLMYQD